MARDTIRYAFWLLLFGLALAYFVGLSTDANSFAAGAQKIIYAVSFRGPNGQLANYPSGAPQGGKVQGG